MAKPVEEDVGDFIKKMITAFASMQTIDGQTLVDDGKIIDDNVPINETLLSNTDKDAVNEYEYIQTRKTGEAINDDEEEKVERLERDILKEKSKGFIYGD